MTRLSLWAPAATTVAVDDGDGSPRPMRRADEGWWHDDRAPSGEYRLVVDGVPIPDPRSPRQPTGLSGPSAPDAADSFAWTDDAWRGFDLRDAVFYELHVGTFSVEGTYDGVAAHLDHLLELGVNVVELMPVATFPGRWGWGYDGALLFAPHHTYGAPDDLRRLIDRCHANGIAVVLDVVYNHLGPTGNHLGMLGPYFTDRYPTPWGAAVNLDGRGSDEVRRFFIDNALHWIDDYHFDGLRVDAVHTLHDESAVHFLEQLGAEVHESGRRSGRTVWVIAESDLNDPRLVREVDAGGLGLDAAWSDDFHHSLHTALTGERSGYYADFDGWPDVARCLDQVWVWAGTYAPFRGRVHGRPFGDLPRSRVFGYGQDHDQIGNRAAGERLAHLVDRRHVEAAAALVLTAPFVPMLFQGEEWSASTPFQFFTDHEDPEIAEATRAGRRAEFGGFDTFAGDVPDPQDPGTFERSVLRWDELDEPEHAGVLRWYRTLIALRAMWPDLRSDSPSATSAHYDAEGKSLRVQRGNAVVAVNAGAVATTIAVGDGLQIAATNDDRALVADGWLALDSWCSAVLVPADAVIGVAVRDGLAADD